MYLLLAYFWGNICTQQFVSRRTVAKTLSPKGKFLNKIGNAHTSVIMRSVHLTAVAWKSYKKYIF